ncbi:hypothetical protein [Mannheimia sp. ZY171111]|uniref:AOC03_06830 family ribosome hibernation factor n=1 Tax=Mannheimia sp. ZY171111 TaxID=2679995 RepID=UPI001ADD82F0|nr:hypothetical protein [Mannheimia sp. ZY171111]QTM01430.1 hypothetical protein GM698_07440 [Mannheimia sp. ZY171111]
MNLKQIKEIQAKHSYPSVTITLPTNRTAPDNEKDAIRLKNLVQDAVTRLESEFGKRETINIVENIQRLADEVDHQHNLDGLVIFANNEFSASYKLPFRLPERASIEDNFVTRDLVYALNRSPLYLLTVLSENGTRLFVGHKDILDEVNDHGFPFSLENVIASASPGQDISHVRDQIVTDHMKEIGDALIEAQKQTPAPIVVVGVDRNIGHFRDGARNSDDIMLYINSGLSNENEHELAKNIWPQIKDALHVERQKIFEEISSAKGNNLFVGGLDEVWQACIDGRVETLIVEEDLHIAANVSEDGRNLTELEGSFEHTENTYEDIVDEMIEKVLETSGRVKFVDNGSLKEMNPTHGIAAITRY